MKKTQKQEARRNIIQLAASVLMNGYLVGFARGKIFTGSTKIVCVPVLNCYSCPGALGACPIGSLQSVMSGRKHRISFYVLGLLMMFGIILGRLVCGFLCPFGLVQDLLHKIPVPKLKIPKIIDKPMRFLKYAVLVFLVLLLPALFRDEFGLGSTYFCKYLCPAGTLGAGLPLLAANESLRVSIGSMFYIKLAILIACIVLSIVIYRPFCKYLCPLGALYSVFNKYSVFRLEVDKDKCIGCGKCERVCGMNVEVTKNINSPECIRCGKCSAACPTGAIRRCPGKNRKNEAQSGTVKKEPYPDTYADSVEQSVK